MDPPGPQKPQESFRLPWLLEGPSEAAQTLRRQFAEQVRARRDLLVVGENGTGKGLLARAIHEGSLHAAHSQHVAPFVEVRLAAGSDGDPQTDFRDRLLGSDAEGLNRSGWIDAARGGTLFLRGLGTQTLDWDTLIRDVLDHCRATPPQDNGSEGAVRVIGAALAGPGAWTMGGSDGPLARFDGGCVVLPPLRDRLDDLATLVGRLHSRMVRGPMAEPLEADALAVLATYEWPGNLWELALVVRWLVVNRGNGPPDAVTTEKALSAAGAWADLSTSPGETVLGAEPGTLRGAVESHLRRYFAWHGDDLPPPGLYDRILKEVERPLLEACLLATGGNQLKAAEILGLNRNTLRKKIKELGICMQRS